MPNKDGKYRNASIRRNKSRERKTFNSFNKKAVRKMKVAMRDGKECAYCGKTDVDLELDHIIPKSKGGSNHLNNLVLSCRECNISKNDKLPHEIDNIKLQQRVKDMLRHLKTKKNWR